MPLYEYQCETCGHRFEAIRKVSDPPPDGCPKCGGAVQKLHSAPAFQFKGSGWYITDYARKDQGGTSAKPEGLDSKDGAKDGSKDKDGSKETTKTESKDTGKASKTSGSDAPTKPSATPSS